MVTLHKTENNFNRYNNRVYNNNNENLSNYRNAGNLTSNVEAPQQETLEESDKE